MFTIADVLESEQLHGRMPRHADGRMKAAHEQTREEFERVLAGAHFLNRRAGERRQAVRDMEYERRREIRREFDAADLMDIDFQLAA